MPIQVKGLSELYRRDLFVGVELRRGVAFVVFLVVLYFAGTALPLL